MAHKEQREFCSKMKEKYPEYFIGKKVLDIGSLDINGNNRFLFTDCNYIGLDVGEGPNVDVVSVGHLYDAPDEYFDTIISTEVFEHDMFYEQTIKNIIRMLKPGGAFIFTCASTSRPEHGTRRCGEHCAPLLIQISEEWADYYKNLVDSDFLAIDGFKDTFSDGFFIYNGESEIPGDIYFFGVKGGIHKTRKYIPNPYPQQTSDGDYINDIFVLGAWPDTESKENDLIDCINRLRAFVGIPILLVSHYPIKPEIQKLVDYYIFDKDNPILMASQFREYDVDSRRWTTLGNVRIENSSPFHHDYAIWTSMTHAFKFCEYLGKKTVHYLEYDNLIDLFQYRQSFLEPSRDNDAIIYEYRDGSSVDIHLDSFMATFIFSVKTEILNNMMKEVRSIGEYFTNRPKGWQLERVFLHYLKKYTKNIIVSKYIANNNELNTQAVWNRDGIVRDDAKFQIYVGLDDYNELYIHLISGFHEERSDKEYLLEIKYANNVVFYNLQPGEFTLVKLGEYIKGNTIRVNYHGKEVFCEYLGQDRDTFKMQNKIIDITSTTTPENQIHINFVDGPIVEIIGEVYRQYNIKFIDDDTDEIIYQASIGKNQWTRCNRKWFTNWRIEIKSQDGNVYTHKLDLSRKRVAVIFESSSLGDTIAWIPYVEEFRKKHNCHLIVSTFKNELFKSEYPEIEFVEPGTSIDNLYALYRIGVFYDGMRIDFTKHKTDFRNLRLQEYASDILGLGFEEIRPRMKSIKPMTSENPYICIANHSTAQSKYWNNPTGWQELVDYVKELGYDVYLLSKEEDGYMGNNNPTGVIKISGKTLEEIGSILRGSVGFVGLSSGLSWLSWALNVPTILISGTTDRLLEPSLDINRIINENVCHGCFSRHLFDKGDWNWCPDHKGTERQFECSKFITFDMVKSKLNEMLMQ